MSRLKVLIVDDDPDVAQTLGLVVKSWGHGVEIAYSGAQTLTVAEKYQPNVILLDIMMPGMDGFKVAQRLRKIIDLKECTIIGVTALNDNEHRYEGYDSGFVHYETKPVNHDRLKKILDNICHTVEVSQKEKEKAVAELTTKIEKRIRSLTTGD